MPKNPKLKTDKKRHEPKASGSGKRSKEHESERSFPKYIGVHSVIGISQLPENPFIIELLCKGVIGIKYRVNFLKKEGGPDSVGTLGLSLSAVSLECIEGLTPRLHRRCCVIWRVRADDVVEQTDWNGGRIQR